MVTPANVTVIWDEVVRATLYVRFSGNWTWDDLHDAGEQVRRMLADGPACVDRSVDLIVDCTDAGPVPLTGSAVANVHLAVRPFQDRVGLFVFVGASATVVSLTRLYTNLYRGLARRYTFAGTLDDARRLLAARRVQHPAPASLPDG